MKLNHKTLRNLDKRAPGIQAAIMAIAVEDGKFIHLSRADYQRLRHDFGISIGLGDTIAKATRAMGIKPCGGCKRRQDKLNNFISY